MLNICYDSRTLQVMTCACCPRKDRCEKRKRTEEDKKERKES